VPIKDQPRLLEIGKAEVVQNFAGNPQPKVALFPLGNMMPLGRAAAAQLSREGYDVAIINPRFTKPLDAGLTEFYGRAADVIVTLEDHVVMGGYGSAVLELFNEKRVTTPVVMIGWPDKFIEHATTVEDLRRKYGLTVENLVAKVKTLLPQGAAMEAPARLADTAASAVA
jgi:1-deoxy-D-xylulose-5-phosphate synthase